MSIAFEAMCFAREVHKHQKRKYTGNTYTDHLGEVAGIVASVCSGHKYSDEMVAIAWLHDTMEDQGVVYSELADKFGVVIANGVLMLSDSEEGNRAERKRLGRERLAKASPEIQTIKYADLISNTSSIVQFDPKFAEVYLEERRLLLEVMDKGDEHLYALACSLCKE